MSRSIGSHWLLAAQVLVVGTAMKRVLLYFEPLILFLASGLQVLDISLTFDQRCAVSRRCLSCCIFDIRPNRQAAKSIIIYINKKNHHSFSFFFK